MSTLKNKVTLTTPDKPLATEDLLLNHILTSRYAYSQGLIQHVDQDGCVTVVDDRLYYLNTAYKKELSYSVSGLEQLNKKTHELVKHMAMGIMHCGPVAASCVISRKGGPIFPKKDNITGVYFRVISGVKLVRVNGSDYWLREGNAIMIPAGLEYTEQNREDSIVLKIEFKKYLEELLS